MNPTDRTVAVKHLYETHPYPSPNAGASLLRDMVGVLWFLFPGQDLSGWRILDAGCGTGHRLGALAKAYRKAQFTGLDISDASLEVARQLAQKHQLANLCLWQGDIAEVDTPERFDLIISTGVVHHLPDPAGGVEKLCRLLTPEGMMLLWLYHRFGEFNRLLQRELVLALAGSASADLETGVNILAELKINLDPEQYGNGVLPQGEICQVSMNVDAFLNPIVHAYRFLEGIELFAGACVDWVAINGITTKNSSSLLDLEQTGGLPDVTLSDERMLGSESLLCKYRQLSGRDRLRVIELATRPAGFSLLAGRQPSLARCNQRIRGNIVELA
ncbi:MAG: class I SAM-dependent methyltransferase [Acidobacteriia bacterium]|nr:class I SAM-dependent methyltransferase [Terriglobia bacterium]